MDENYENINTAEKAAFLIKNITEYGKLLAYCINNDINVWRTYWDEREPDTCYYIDWKTKRCSYSEKRYWVAQGYKIYTPIFVLDSYGNYILKKPLNYCVVAIYDSSTSSTKYLKSVNSLESDLYPEITENIEDALKIEESAAAEILNSLYYRYHIKGILISRGK